jgi:hypothetical protein
MKIRTRLGESHYQRKRRRLLSCNDDRRSTGCLLPRGGALLALETACRCGEEDRTTNRVTISHCLIIHLSIINPALADTSARVLQKRKRRVSTIELAADFRQSEPDDAEKWHTGGTLD